MRALEAIIVVNVCERKEQEGRVGWEGHPSILYPCGAALPAPMRRTQFETNERREWAVFKAMLYPTAFKCSTYFALMCTHHRLQLTVLVVIGSER